MRSNIRPWLASKRGPLLVLLSQILAGLMNLCVQALVTKRKFAVDANNKPPLPISPFRILNARMITTLALSSLYCWARNVEDFPAGPRHVQGLLLLRAAGGCCGATGFYLSLQYLPLAEATVLNLLAPLGCCVLGAVLLQGTLSAVQIGAAVSSAVGVFITARPSSLSSALKPLDNASDGGMLVEESTVERERLVKGIPFALLGAFGGACAYTCIRLMGTRVHPLVSVNYFALAMIVVSSIAVLLEKRSSPFKFDLLQVGLVVAIGIASFLAEFVMTAGLAVERASSSTLMIFSQVLFATLLDWVFWGLLPNLTSAIGAVILIMSLAAVLVQQATGTHVQKDTREETQGVYCWFQVESGRKSTHNSDPETLSLESLLPSDEERV